MRASLVLNLRARAASLREQIFHLRRFRGPRGTIRMVRSFVSLTRIIHEKWSGV